MWTSTTVPPITPSDVTEALVPRGRMLTDHDFCIAPYPEQLVGRFIDTPVGVGVAVQCRDGVRVRLRLRCREPRCRRRITVHLAAAAAGLCSINTRKGAYLGDLRNDEYVCPGHRRPAR